MLTKISLILLLSFSLCLAETPKLRSGAVFRPALLIDILSDSIGPLNIVPNLMFTASESDYLNEFAQALADTTTNPISFINNYPKSKYSKSILTFGFKLRGDTKIETILLGDSSEVVEHMSGFLDFRVDNATLSMEAKEIRDSIRNGRCYTTRNYSPKNCAWTKSSGFLTVNTDNFVQSVNIRNIRDILPMVKLYDAYLENRLKTMDKDGNMQLGFAPLNLRIEMKNFKLNLESTNSSLFPFKADKNMPRDELYATIDEFYRGLVQNAPLEEALQLSKRINTYGFGIALDANKDINVVYSFGQQGDYQPRARLADRLSNYEYVTPKGNKLNFDPFDYENNNFVAQQIKYNKLMMDAENLNRLNEGLRPIRYTDPKSFQLALKEAERMAAAGKLSAPVFTQQTKDTVLVAMYTVGKTNIREFVFDINDNEVGTIACFDNFTNSRPKVYNLFESYGTICNKEAAKNWKDFDTMGSGVASNANGDVVNVIVLTKKSPTEFCLNKEC